MKFELLADLDDQPNEATIQFDACEELRAVNLRGTGFAARDVEVRTLTAKVGGVVPTAEINVSSLAGFLLAIPQLPGADASRKTGTTSPLSCCTTIAVVPPRQQMPCGRPSRRTSTGRFAHRSTTCSRTSLARVIRAGNQPSHMPHGHTEVIGDLMDVQQPRQLDRAGAPWRPSRFRRVRSNCGWMAIGVPRPTR